MIDIHCHILPGLDDGAKDLSTSLALARQLSQAGFRKVIATPHVFEGRRFLRPETIRQATVCLNNELRREGIPLEVIPGAENYIFPELPRYLKEGKILTLGDSHKYVLLELPMQGMPIYAEHVIFTLQMQRIVPVLAHPERCCYLAGTTEILKRWHNKGVLFQINLRSLEGIYGERSKELAEWLLANDIVQVAGTDAHRPSTRHDGYEKTVALFSQMIDPQYLVRCLEVYPQAILDGKEQLGIKGIRRA